MRLPWSKPKRSLFEMVSVWDIQTVYGFLAKRAEEEGGELPPFIVFAFMFLAAGEGMARLGVGQISEPADRDVVMFECLAFVSATIGKNIAERAPGHPTIIDDLRRGAIYVNTMVQDATGWDTGEIARDRYQEYRYEDLEEPASVLLARIIGTIRDERKPNLRYAGPNPEQMTARTLKIGIVTKGFEMRAMPNFVDSAFSTIDKLCVV